MRSRSYEDVLIVGHAMAMRSRSPARSCAFVVRLWTASSTRQHKISPDVYDDNDTFTWLRLKELAFLLLISSWVLPARPRRVYRGGLPCAVRLHHGPWRAEL
jgi:hypothetical protein